jgi:NO-binding membrane sensor protein with MHYT domain
VNPFPLWLHLAAVLTGIGVGLVDFTLAGDNPVPALLLLAIPTFTFGLARPQGAWRWGLLVGLGIPAVHLAAAGLGFRPPYPVRPSPWITLVALIPALLSAYLGVLVRRFGLRRPHRSE